MEHVTTLSTLLAEADTLLEQLRSKQPYQLRTPEQRSAFNARYKRWFDASRAALPDDLRTNFERELSHISATPDAHNETTQSWGYYNSLQFTLEEQRKQLFLARRRLWTPASSLPKDVHNAIATVCKTSYAPYTLDNLFVASGCEQHWYIPHTRRATRSKTLDTVLGWLDGTLLYAPEREVPILHALCEAILENQRLTAANRERIEQIMPLLQPPAPADPLAAYALHATVVAIAAPLVAIAHYDEAILKVCIALNNDVQRRSSRPDLDGTSLMQQVFAPRSPILPVSNEPSEQQGWMHLFTGAIMALRNPRAHKLGQDTSLAETIEWLTFLSALFRTLDRSS